MTAPDNQSQAKAVREESPVHQQLLLVSGLLGGIAFTALVLVLQARASFEVPSWGIWGEVYFNILVSFIAGVSTLFVYTSVSVMPIAGGTWLVKSKLGNFGVSCFLYGFLGLLVILPMLLIPFTLPGMIVIATFEIALFFYWNRIPFESREATPGEGKH